MNIMTNDSTQCVKSFPDLDLLISKYEDKMLRMCFLYLKDMHLAQDAVQDTFIKAYHGYPNLKDIAGEKAWITRIAINVCKNYLRASWWKHIDADSALESIPAVYDDGLADDDTLLVNIMNLKPKYKEVILLFYYQDMKIKEISQTLKIPEGTVSARLKRARGILKNQLKGWYYDDNE